VRRDADLAGWLFVAAGNALFIVHCSMPPHIALDLFITLSVPQLHLKIHR